MIAPRRLLLPASAAVAILALAAPACADALELADGRVVEGRVTKEGEVYRVASRFGEAEFAAKDVVSWKKEPSVEAEWRERLSKLDAKDAAGRGELAKWLAEKGRAEEAAATARAALEVDPEEPVAHGVLGHVRHKGQWMTPDEAKRSDGLEEHGGRWYTPEEWAVVSAEGRRAAEETDRAAVGKRLSARANEAVRAMLSPDPALRAKGKETLEALARETRTEGFANLAKQVEAYAKAADRFSAALDGRVGSGETAEVLTECRIQFAKLKRPMATLTTSLASNIGGAPVVIQLPELEVVKIKTTVKLPAGTGP
jgi:hypothetical protein